MLPMNRFQSLISPLMRLPSRCFPTHATQSVGGRQPTRRRHFLDRWFSAIASPV